MKILIALILFNTTSVLAEEVPRRMKIQRIYSAKKFIGDDFFIKSANMNPTYEGKLIYPYPRGRKTKKKGFEIGRVVKENKLKGWFGNRELFFYKKKRYKFETDEYLKTVYKRIGYLLKNHSFKSSLAFSLLNNSRSNPKIKRLNSARVGVIVTREYIYFITKIPLYLTMGDSRFMDDDGWNDMELGYMVNEEEVIPIQSVPPSINTFLRWEGSGSPALKEYYKRHEKYEKN